MISAESGTSGGIVTGKPASLAASLEIYLQAFVVVIYPQHSLMPNSKRHANTHPQQQPSFVDVAFFRMVIVEGVGGV
jgi:hypothetical protein